MNRCCTNCGSPVEPEDKFCLNCGTQISSLEPKNENKGKKAPQKSIKKNKKTTSKKRKKGGLIFLVVIVSIIAVVAFVWFAVGNYFTLKNHTDDVLAAFNSEDLNVAKFQKDPYEDLPLYAVEMLGETKKSTENGPIVTAMTPYLKFERVKINGFFGGHTVEYRIVSRDIESWILSLDYSTVQSTEQLQQMLIEYIPNAPLKEYYVTIEYTKDGMFGWYGNYETVEFADAISGGLNSAYNQLNERMMKELEEFFNENE